MKFLWQNLVVLGQQSGCFHLPPTIITIFNKCHEVKGWETLSNSTSVLTDFPVGLLYFFLNEHIP